MSAQTPATDASLAIASLEDALSSIDRISYLADFRLKELNSDTFDVDKFEVAAIRDTARGSDRFNWLIREHGKSSHFAHLYSAGRQYIGAELFLDFYTRQGYTVNQPNRKSSTAPDSENLSLQSRIDSLLRAPMQSFSGDTVRLSDIKSKWLLVDFWYLACPPCLEAMPVLQKAYDKYEEQGFKVIGVNVLDAQIKEKIAGFLDENGITYPSYFATKTLARSIGVTTYPTFFLLDENRKLVLQHKGLTDDFQELLGKALGQPSH